jgi:hypothetical protein
MSRPTRHAAALDLSRWWRLPVTPASLLIFAPAGFSAALKRRGALPARFPQAYRARLLNALERLDHELPSAAGGDHSEAGAEETARRIEKLLRELEAIREQTARCFGGMRDGFEDAGGALARDHRGFARVRTIRRLEVLDGGRSRRRPAPDPPGGGERA